MSKSTLYLLRGAGIGALGAVAYAYFSKRAKTQAQTAPASYSFPIPETELRSDMRVAALPIENRVGFVKKVYGVVALQTGAVALSTILAFRYPALYRAVLIPSVILGSVGAIGSVIAMHSQRVRGDEQLKKVCLGVFTLSEMLAMPSVCLPFPKEIVVSALTSTGMITGAMTAYAHTSKRDFTAYQGWVASMLLAFLGLSVVFLFIPRRLPQQVLAWAGASLFSFILVHDTQKVMGKGSNPYRYGDYDIAAVNIYLDVINLFIQILKIMGNSKKDK